MKLPILSLATLVAGLMSVSVLAGEMQRHANETLQEVRVLTPVVKVIALNGEYARQFNASRERFREVRNEVLESNEQYLQSLLAEANIEH